MNIPVHEDRKILSLHPCYANCTSRCSNHPGYRAS
jgi:hypothetical protein